MKTVTTVFNMGKIYEVDFDDVGNAHAVRVRVFSGPTTYTTRSIWKWDGKSLDCTTIAGFAIRNARREHSI